MTLAQVGYSMLERSGALAAWRRLSPDSVILMYHNVIPSGDTPRGESSLHLPADRFAAQMRWLAAHFDVVPLEQLAASWSAGRRESLAAITFDDACRGVIRHGLPVLASLDLPATLFVVADGAQGGDPFWWDVVAERRPDEERQRLRIRFGGDGAEICRALGIEPGRDDLSDDYRPAGWDELRRALRQPGIEVGVHTVSHPMLTAVVEARLEDELSRGRSEIADNLGVAPTSIAYPYGDCDDRVVAAAERLGYRIGVTTRGGRLKSAAKSLLLPRETVSAGMSPGSFAAAASGLRWHR